MATLFLSSFLIEQYHEYGCDPILKKKTAKNIMVVLRSRYDPSRKTWLQLGLLSILSPYLHIYYSIACSKLSKWDYEFPSHSFPVDRVMLRPGSAQDRSPFSISYIGNEIWQLFELLDTFIVRKILQLHAVKILKKKQHNTPTKFSLEVATKWIDVPLCCSGYCPCSMTDGSARHLWSLIPALLRVMTGLGLGIWVNVLFRGPAKH